tara:strand:+ start:13589 stop:13990 length:402 start_codon:yes stop_codon:yes gene_type:complete
MFTLDAQLAKDSSLITELELCQLRLINDAHYPWVLLIPQRENIVELLNLSVAEQQQWLIELNHVSQTLRDIYQPDKLNIAALGNVVKQFHTHIIARYQTDACWPKPVWGQVQATPYTDEQRNTIITKIKHGLA